MYIPTMTKSPWAKFTTFIMPQISVRPEENSAYTAPSRRPPATTWAAVVTAPYCCEPLNGHSSACCAAEAGQMVT